MLRFTIRDMLWLMMVVALGIGVCLERARRVKTQKDSVEIFTQNENLRSENKALRAENYWLLSEVRLLGKRGANTHAEPNP